MRLRCSLALLALLSLAAFAGCGGGGDSQGGAGMANDPFYGVVSADLPDGRMLDSLGRGGAGTLRVNLAWGNVQPTPSSGFHWDAYDKVVGGAARNGVRVLATVFSSPTWVEPSPETPPTQSGAVRAFQFFTGAAVQRYGSNGSFWREHPGLPKLPIRDWQLWNEPNSPLFWKPAPDIDDYVKLLGAFGGVVKAIDPSARILLAGLFPTPRLHGGISLDTFLSGIYRKGGAKLFDAIAVHPYAATPSIALDRIAEARRLMDRFGDDDTPIWITEVGWASTGRPPGLVVGEQGQADYLKRTFELAQDERERLKIAGVVWFSLSDTPGPIWVGHCGLFTVDGSPKPAWAAFADVAGGSA
jgi:polysaccharide biosynthesis protein PslG